MKLLMSNIGRLRIVGFLEGISYLVLLFICVPVKYFMKDPSWVKMVGPIHGALFVLFVIMAISVSISRDWKMSKTTWKVLLASIVPFGTFYVDSKILKNEPQ